MSSRALSFPDSESVSVKGNARPISLTEKDISRFRSLISAPVKGIYKGTLDFGKVLPMLVQGPNLIPYLLTGHSVISKPVEEGYKKGLQKAEEFIDEELPTHPEFLESALERGGKLVPGGLAAVATGGASLLPQLGLAAAGGLAGQAVEEFGGHPLLQAAAESIPYALPSLARKIMPSNADQEKILQVGRKYGLTEEQLAPLMPEAGKKRFFGRYAHAGESAQEPLRESRQGIQNIYQVLETSPSAKKTLSQNSLNQFSQEMNAIGMKMPHNIRSQLKNDAADLVQSALKKGGLEGSELMNFYHDISSRYNLGRSQLELFKNPVKKALRSIDPHLAKDFETVNRMFQKSAQIGRIMRPSEYEHLISLGEAYEVGASVANLDPGRLTRLLGFAGFRKFSEKMLTSPRLQNMIRKTQIAIENNKLPLLKNMGDAILKEFQEKDTED